MVVVFGQRIWHYRTRHDNNTTPVKEVTEMRNKHVSLCLFLLGMFFTATVLLLFYADLSSSVTFEALCFLLPASVFIAVLLMIVCVRSLSTTYTSSHSALSNAESTFLSLSALTHLPKGSVKQEDVERILRKK